MSLAELITASLVVNVTLLLFTFPSLIPNITFLILLIAAPCVPAVAVHIFISILEVSPSSPRNNPLLLFVKLPLLINTSPFFWLDNTE